MPTRNYRYGQQWNPDGSGSSLLGGLVAYYKLDETSGTRADQLNTWPLTDNNTVTSGVGIIGNAAKFTAASGEYLSAVTGTTAPFGRLSTRSIAGWVYLDTTQAAASFASIQSGLTTSDGDPNLFLTANADGTPGAFKFYAGGYSALTTAFTTGWHHFAYTFIVGTPGDSKLYIDGVFRVGRTFAPGGSGGNFFIGQGFNGYYDERVDEVGVWSRVLSQVDITNLHNAGAGTTYPFLGIP